MTKKRLFLCGTMTFFLINKGVFAWGSFDVPTTYYTYGGDLPSVYDGYTLTNDNRMYMSGLATYGQNTNSCDETLSRNVSLGSKGEDVATLQDYLFDQDFLQTQPNGYFGYGTQNAVKLFQSRYGIRATGITGPQTRNLLNNLICGGDAGVNNVASSQTKGNVTEIVPTITNTYSQGVYYPTPSNLNNSFSPSQVSNVNVTNQSVYTNGNFTPSYIPVTVNRAPTVTIVIPLNKSMYKEGDTIPATWVTSNMNANRFSIMMENTSTGLQKQIAALPGSVKQYNITLTKELLDSVCAGTTACASVNASTYKFYVVAYYQTIDGELSIKAYADQMTIMRPEVITPVTLTPSKNPVSVGEQIKIFAYVPNTPLFTQYQNLYWRMRAVCAPGVTLTVNGQACGTDIYIYQANINTSPDITVQINGNMWGPTEVNFEASVLSYYGGQELGRATTKILVNK